MGIRRGFVDVREGQIHYRSCGTSAGNTPTLVMLHASPGSAKSLEPLMQNLGRTRAVVALDTLGNGDSSAPIPEVPDIPYFAQGALQAIDGMDLQTFDLYGTHTGASIAIEISVTNPKRVRKLILDGVSVFTDAARQEMLIRHAPIMKPAEDGSHLVWSWHFVRDRFLFWPWYERTRAHRRDIEFPSAEALHDMTLEVLKALRTYHLSYNAAFRYRKQERLPLVAVPALITTAVTDMLYPQLEEAARLLPGCSKAPNQGYFTDKEAAETTALFTAFLDK